MRKVAQWLFGAVCLALLLAASPARAADATNTISWRLKQNQVDAEMQKWPLSRLLKKIATVTGWKVYVEPGTTGTFSAKFKNLPEDEALQRLLGNLNYFRDATNGVQRLFVFRTASKAATQAVLAGPKKDYRIPNELLVKLKRNATNSIDELAKKLGAKVIGRNDKIGFYRLQFPDGSTADTALQSLSSDPSVAAVDSNYVVDPPTPFQLTQNGSAPAGPLFNLNPPDVNGPIVGLIDTSVDPPSEFQKYMLTPVSVVGTSEEPTDEPTHGTGMLETILDSMAANPSMVLPVDVYGSGESTSTYPVILGIADAINAGANPINLSLGGTGDSQILGSLIQEAEQKGIVFVAATGNSGASEDDYPAAYPGVLSVTASDPNGQKAIYANDGPETLAMEPGSAPIIWNGQEWVFTGTSTATAIMTGLITGWENLDHVPVQQSAAHFIQANPAPRRQ